MNCLLLFLICVGFHCAICAPTQQVMSMYDAIVEKCPLVQSFSTYKNYPVFKTCNNWRPISMIEESTSNNKEIRCLLYYHSFVQYCTDRTNINTTVSKTDLVNYTLNNVCDYAKTVPSINRIISKNDICQEICKDDAGFVDTLCAISVYFGSQKISEISGNNKVQTLDYQNQHVKNSQQHHQNLDANPANNKGTNEVAPKVDNPDEDSRINPPPPQPAADVPQPKSTVDESNKNPGQVDKQKTTTEQQKADEGNTSQKIMIEQSSEALGPVQTKVQVEPIGDTAGKQNVNADIKLNNKPDVNLETNPNPQPQPISDNVDGIPEQDKTDQNQPSGRLDTDVVDDDDMQIDGDDINLPPVNDASEKAAKPLQIDETDSVNSSTEMDGDSYFFTYFMVLCIIFIAGYVCYHNKQKILALILEGRRGKRQYRGRRPNSANYHKLDSNLEEAITSSCKKNTNNVIY